MAFKIDYTEDNGKTWKEATVVKTEGGIFGTVTLTDDTDVTKKEKTVKATQTKMRVRIS